MRAPRLAWAAIVAAAVLTISSLLPGARAFLLPSRGTVLALRRLQWTAAAAAAASSSSLWSARRGGLLVVVAAQQQQGQEQGHKKENAVRSLFTDAAERRRKQQEAAQAASGGDNRLDQADDDEEEEEATKVAASRAAMAAARGDINVLGGALELCGTDPMTGFTREGCCTTGPQDFGSHTVCAVVTEGFLNYSRSRGNDLITPRPEYRFPGLKPGDRWCLCASRWQEAMVAGVAPQVVLKATHRKALEVCTLEDLVAHAVDPPSGNEGAKEEL